MSRSSHSEMVQRLNAAFHLIALGHTLVDAAEALTEQFGLSRRQAYRYLQQAEKMSSPVSLHEPNIPITFKLPADVIVQLRAHARANNLTIGETVAHAVRAFLAGVGRHG
jgi:predicted DNA-binding transcriptional regulator YafY